MSDRDSLVEYIESLIDGTTPGEPVLVPDVALRDLIARFRSTGKHRDQLLALTNGNTQQSADDGVRPIDVTARMSTAELESVLAGTARARVAQFWDAIVEEFIENGNDPLYDPFDCPPLSDWRRAYDGKGRGKVIDNALPEPYLGDILGEPKMVVLALNPGAAHLDFQSASGVFADEIVTLGSYRDWAATWPYLRDPWDRVKGANRHHQARLAFMRRWHVDPDLGSGEMLAFELFPWHSSGVTAAMRPDPYLIRQFVWDPISELGDAPVFAFGAPWFGLLEHDLGLQVVARLGAGGRDYGSTVASRSVVMLESPTGGQIIAEKHAGSATPPSAAEVQRLRDAVEPLLNA